MNPRASSDFGPVPVRATLPVVGFINCAAIRSRVVFPAPFAPSNATNSPPRIASEIFLKATSEPKRFSTLSKAIPIEFLSGTRSEGWELARGSPKAIYLATNEIAERCIDALALAGIVLFADGPGLPPQFETEKAILQLVKAASHLAVNFRSHRCGRRGWRRCLCRSLWSRRFIGISSHAAAGRRLHHLRAPQKIHEPQRKNRSEPAHQNPFQAVEPRRNCRSCRGCGISSSLRARIYRRILRTSTSRCTAGGHSAARSAALRGGLHRSGSRHLYD